MNVENACEVFDTLLNHGHRQGRFAGDPVRPLQVIIVGWMQRQLDRTNWSAEHWARQAGLSPTTVTRAMSPAYESVSSVTTLHSLARAADVPSLIDFLEGQSTVCCDFPVMLAILEEVLPTAGCRLSQDKLEAAAEAIGRAICGMVDQPPARRKDPEFARALARAARRVFYR